MRVPSSRLAAAIVGLVSLASAAAVLADDDVRAGILLRYDTDTTEVISPHARGRFRVLDEHTHVDLEYTADIWTSASIDVRTAATVAVTEQRDEINAGVDRELGDVTLRGGYRFSIEHDYQAHGGVLGLAHDFADNNATIDVMLRAEYDAVTRSGDTRFSRELAVFGGRATYTQVIDPQMLVQGAFELSYLSGFQSSPYRYVGIGGDGRCGGTAQLCVPEAHPGSRVRSALVLRARRALTEQLSLHADYRFYVDDWAVYSNTAALQLNWSPDERTLVAFRYRFYQQGPAWFYRSVYALGPEPLVYASRDRELSQLWTHRLAVSFERSIDLAEAGPTMRIGAALAGTYIGYDDFVGLSEVMAVDLTVDVGVEL